MITGNEPAMPLTIDLISSDIMGKMARGLTIRQHFAAMAMQSIIVQDEKIEFGFNGHKRSKGINEVAEESVMYADALIAELNKKATE